MANIMIVDDDDAILDLQVEIVEGLGHKPIRCVNAETAWTTLCSGRDVDVVITDVVMPGMDGRDLVRWMMSDPKLKHIPIIMISGIVDVKEISKLVDIGDVAFLGKPIRLLSLQTAINESLKKGTITTTPE